MGTRTVIQVHSNVTSEWYKDGNCYNKPNLTDLFFSLDWRDEDEAKRICSDCPVRMECLNYALALNQSAAGVWGGTNERERKNLKQRRYREIVRQRNET